MRIADGQPNMGEHKNHIGKAADNFIQHFSSPVSSFDARTIGKKRDMQAVDEAKRKSILLTNEWAEMLKSLMVKGTRPTSSERIGVNWGNSELAEILGVSARMVGLYRSGRNLPDTPAWKKLQAAFFGSTVERRHHAAHSQFQRLYDVEKRKKQGGKYFGAYGELSTVELVWEAVKRRADLLVDDAILEASNTEDLAWLIGELDRNKPHEKAREIARDACAMAFTKKYGSLTEEDDERHKSGIDIWRGEIAQIFERMRVSYGGRMLCIGMGCGLEGVGLYDRFREFIGVDISDMAVERSRKVFSGANCKFIASRAEELDPKLGDFDVVISLKTFSSSFFDIDAAVVQISRVLKEDGVAIISVPRGYYDDNDFLLPGLARTTYNLGLANKIGTYRIADKSYPLELIKDISLQLYRRRFSDVAYYSGRHEHYILARKM